MIRLWLHRHDMTAYDWAVVADTIIVAGAVVLLALMVAGVLA